jgi:hypothetical protein
MLGLEVCSIGDWMFFMCLHLVCFGFTFYGIYVCYIDYNRKLECNYEFVAGDLILTPKIVTMFMLIAWVGAFISAFCGIGGGSIFCPVLIIIGMEARVATATGMYLTLFTSLSYVII